MQLYKYIEQRALKAEQENERLRVRLKSVAIAIQESGIEQPSQCLFGDGSCGYPIDDCFNCPRHEWSPFGMPFTKCEFL